MHRQPLKSGGGVGATLIRENQAGPSPDLSALLCPLLAFWGSDDPVTPPEAARLIASAASEGRTGVVECAAHWCAIEDPDATNDVLFGFLDQLALQRTKPGWVGD